MTHVFEVLTTEKREKGAEKNELSATALPLNDLTGTIVDASLKIHKKMGPGLYEKVYEDCLAYELEKRGITFSRQQAISVAYEELRIDNAFKIDLLADNRVVIELKSTDKILPLHEAQIMTYMRLASVKTDLLINFNVRLIKDGIKRFRL